MDVAEGHGLESVARTGHSVSRSVYMNSRVFVCSFFVALRLLLPVDVNLLLCRCTRLFLLTFASLSNQI